MYAFITIKKSILTGTVFAITICAFSIALYNASPALPSVAISEEHIIMLDEMFKIRSKAFLDNDLKLIETLYNKKTKFGIWALEHEKKKMKYLHDWADKQGIKFTDIKPKVKIYQVKERGSGYLINFIASTEYHYHYENQPEITNFFRIGTYHSMNLDNVDGQWLISKEWYTDPFADSLNTDNIKVDEFKQYLLNSSPRDFSKLNKRRISAVEYADRYCGAAADEQYGYSYNKKYKNYNPLGGDCANFASQILYEGGKFKQTGAWRYEKDGSKAWVNAHAFNSYMLYSGRGSLIARGTYNQVFKASFKLLPGDYIAYEKKGKVVHISVVTGADSKGYTLVNCHNTDRYRVPWDLGWSDKGIKFWLVRVNY